MAQQGSFMSFALKFGVGITFLLIIHSLLMLILGLQEVTFLQYISYFIILAGLIWAIKSYRDDHLGGYGQYGQVLGAGVMVALILSVLYGIYTYIFVKFIDPELVDKIMKRTEEALIRQGQSDEAIETALQWTKSMTSPPMMAVWSAITYFVFGTIVSLIASAFLKKEKRSGYYS